MGLPAGNSSHNLTDGQQQYLLVRDVVYQMKYQQLFQPLFKRWDVDDIVGEVLCVFLKRKTFSRYNATLSHPKTYVYNCVKNLLADLQSSILHKQYVNGAETIGIPDSLEVESSSAGYDEYSLVDIICCLEQYFNCLSPRKKKLILQEIGLERYDEERDRKDTVMLYRTQRYLGRICF
jgi:DNA-directed RNA polymerase specialized sigma24 family protein